jgi:MoxR-like ATPase
LRARLPDVDARLAEQIAAFMEFLRALPLRKVPGVAESLDWALALTRLHRDALDESTLEKTRGCILKVQEDWALLRSHAARYAPLLANGTTGGAEAAPRESDYGLGSVQARRG